MTSEEASLSQEGIIDTDAYAQRLRQRSIIGKDRFLITNLKASLQENDLAEGTNCQGFGRVRHFRDQKTPDWVANPLPHQVGAWKLGLTPTELERAQVFQNASCNWRCWYCYVDFELLAASRSRADFKTARDLLELFLIEENRPKLIDLSGGQPDIIPEWPIRMMEALVEKGIQNDYYLWMDDNLSTYFPWQYLGEQDFRLLREYRNFGRVGCFKGFSPESFRENTRASPEMLTRQIDIISKWVREGVDTYGYITLTSSSLVHMRSSLRDFMNSVQSRVSHFFLLRTIPLEILRFTPTVHRMKDVQERAIKNQYDILATWLDEINDRYSRSERDRPVYDIPLGSQ